MITKQEGINILIISLIIGFSLSLIDNLQSFLLMFSIALLIILVNVFGKKLAAYYYDTKIEHKIWEIQRYGFTAGSHFQRPFPIGLILPILVSVLTLGQLTWLNGLYFESKPEIYAVAKRRKHQSYFEFDERLEAIIVIWGILANILFAIPMYLIGFTLLAKMSIFYTIFNIIPLGKLDGNKLFFGSSSSSKMPEEGFIYKLIIWVVLIANVFALLL